jgi:hypothetical protein
MATAQEYASWLQRNSDKRGTPDYQTVLRAFQEASLEELDAQRAVAAPAAQPEGGFFPAIRAGFEGLKGAGAAFAGKVGLMPEEEAQAAYEAAQKRQKEIFKPTEEGWTEAPVTKFLETFGGSLPYMAAPLAAGAAAATLPVTGSAAAVTALGAAGLASATQFTATNLARQLETGKKLAETDLGAAALTAIPQAALDTLSLRLLPGVGRLLGDAGIKVTKETAKEVSEQILKKAAIDYTAQTGKAMGREGLTEAAQQALERLQAGLNLTDPEARQEYLDSLIGGAVLGGTIAPVGRYVERGRAARQVGAIEQEEAAAAAKTAREAEAAEKASPEYALKLDADYQAAVAKMRELQTAVKQKPAKDADPSQWAEYNQKVAELKEFTANTMRPLTAEYTPRKAEIAKLKEQQRIEGMTPLEYQMEQAGVDLTATPKEERVFTGEEEFAPPPASEETYAQQKMQLAQQQDMGTFEAKDFAEYLMQDPAMAQRLVDAQTPIPGVSKKDSNAILSALKLQLGDIKKQEQKATAAELQQRQADLRAQQPTETKDPLELWKASITETEEQATDELLRPDFSTLKPTEKSVEVAPGITPIQRPEQLLRRIDELVAARDQAAKDTDTAFASGNKELGVQKAQEREAAQTALNQVEQTEGPGRALVSLRKAQDAALMNTAQLVDDLRVGRTLSGPEAGTASSTPQTLINQINRERAAYINAAIQEAAINRKLYGKGLPQEEAIKAGLDMKAVFDEWVTRSMAQPRREVMEERVVQPAQMRGTEVVRGAETEMVDPRPLEERRFGSYRAAAAVLDEQLRDIAAKLKEVPRTFSREEPLLKMQFPETEAAKVAEASGETAKTLEGALRRRRDYVSGLIDQAFQTRKVPGIAEMLLTRARDFIDNGTNDFLDAAENIASRILRGQNIERSDLVTMRAEIRAASARPGEAEVAGERVGQRELFPAEERRALAPKEPGGALGTIREKPAAFEAVRAKEAAKQKRVEAAVAKSEKLTSDIKKELDRIDAERLAMLEQRVADRSSSLQSAWQSAVKKAKSLVVQARKSAAKEQVAGLKKELAAIYKGGVEGLDKSTIDRFYAVKQELADIDAKVNEAVDAVEFLPQALANKWLQFESTALQEAQQALDAARTPQNQAKVQQQQGAMRRAEQARLQSLKGEEKAAEAARMRAAQGQIRDLKGQALPGQRRVAGRVEEIREGTAAETAEERAVRAEERRAARAAEQEGAVARGEVKQAQREALEQRVADFEAQITALQPELTKLTKQATRAQNRLAAEKGAPNEKLEKAVLSLGTKVGALQTEIDTLSREKDVAQAQLAAFEETKPRKKGPAMAISGAGLAKQRPLRTGTGEVQTEAARFRAREANLLAEQLKAQTPAQKKAAEKLEAAIAKEQQEEDIKTRRRESRLQQLFEGPDEGVFFSRGPTTDPSTTASVRKELSATFPDLGRVQIFDSVEALVEANPQYDGLIPDDARGFVDSAGNKAFLIAENINKGDSLAVLLHEVGAHIGLKNMLGAPQYNALVKGVETWAKRNDGSPEARVAKAAQERVKAAKTPANQKDDETLAYAIEEAVKAGVTPTQTKTPLGQWLARIAQAFRKALEKFGLPPKALDAQGLVDMAFGAAKVEMAGDVKTVQVKGEKTEPGEILFSRNLPIASRVADSLIAKERGWLDKLKDNFLGMGARTQFVDKLAPTEEALKRGGADPTKAMQAMYYLRMYDQRMHFTSQAITDGVPELATKTRRDGTTERLIETKPGANIKQIVDILKKKDVVKAAGSADAANKLFTLYLAARRAESKGYDKLNFKVSEADIKAARAEIEADPTLKQAFEEARDIYNQYNRNLLEFAVQTGALSREEAKRLLADNDYVPYYRVRNGVAELIIGNETPIRIGNLKDSPHLKELVGGDEAIFDFLTSSVQNTSMLLDMATKNLATKNLAFELQEVGLAKIRKAKKGESAPAGAFEFKRDGEDYFAVVDTDAIGIDSDLLVKGLAGIPTMFPAFVRVFGVPARLLRRAVVASPVYMARQLFRDTLGASLTSGADIVPVLSALKQIGKPNVLQGRGITGGQVFTGMPEDVTRMLKDMQAGKISVTSGLSWLEAKAAQVDALTRQAQYDSYIKQGLSEMEATYMALESMNFSKRGLSPTLHMFSTLIPFFNAQIQGLDVLYKAFTGQMPMNERLAIRQKLWERGLLLAGMSVAYAMAMQDDETYKNAKPDEKYGNWFVSVPGFDQKVRLPIPFELGYVFKSLPEAVVNIAMNDKGAEEAQKALTHIVQQMVPGLSSYFIPQAVKPALETVIGTSLYTGRGIESAREQAVEPGYRYRESTTELAKQVGELTGFSPIKMEYLIRGYTGSMGMALLAALSAPFGSSGPEAATKRLSDLPVVGTLFQPKDASGIIDATYERVNKIQQVQQTYKALLNDGRRDDAQAYAERNINDMMATSIAGEFRQIMGDITKQEREVRASGMTPDKKREMLERFRQAKIRIATSVRAALDRKTPQAVPA